MELCTFHKFQSIFLVENQLKTIQSVIHNGRIKYNVDHFVYIDIYVDKYNIITSILHRLENSHKKTFQAQQRDTYGILFIPLKQYGDNLGYVLRKELILFLRVPQILG